jgi:hypothetical protein
MNAPKIPQITIEVTARGTLTNAAAYDETGQFRGDITTGNPEDVNAYVDTWKANAEQVTVNDTRCLSVKAIGEARYRCKLPAYHGGYCEHVRE